ncbi:hypothetical protein PXK00_03505 [Phaeobacter sp. QD34_3]|uniref:hypothetical protein n=1 Tax=unclassified Phaeobacter TaxID=2621772 RepID=UPI00237F2E12|nr:MULTISPECIES: hypothetical protein [unclassified Phaeobacter]MDE4132162.1 hypothetical protein [Phaeobacter sp. QD34_3]MDE4135800.1 hypothetical protein [Phaeobacter sp. QD34_24]MDE4172585.1 hypothetical protein [Phaeobacter sp. PT47_59]
MIRLSDIVKNGPEISDFWALERCVSMAARTLPPARASSLAAGEPASQQGGSILMGDTEVAFLNCDIVPEFRDTPRKWQIILIAAFERGQRARASLS